MLFSDRKDSSEVTTKGYEDALLLVTQTIDKIMTGDGIEQQDLVMCPTLSERIPESPDRRSYLQGWFQSSVDP
jgi:hypothetical protein